MSARLKGCLFFIWFGHVFFKEFEFFYFKLIIFLFLNYFDELVLKIFLKI
jgi:hypothetical protein